MIEQKIEALVLEIKNSSNGMLISTAESCTGGMLASFLTSIPGSSLFFSHGIVSYSDKAKIDLLRVSSRTLSQYGAVSEEVALEMAKGCIHKSDIAVSITGIAGPDGGSDAKPIGTVCFAIVTARQSKSCSFHLNGTRSSIRLQSCKIALELILESLAQ
jgi:PncC family amidohydrolase